MPSSAEASECVLLTNLWGPEMRRPASLSPAYVAAQFEGRAYRQAFRRLLPWVVSRPIRPPLEIACQVWSLSSERDVAEQVASIRSFLRYVGRPTNWNVVSDGSHTDDTRRLLHQVDPSVRVRNLADVLPAKMHPEVQRMMSGREPHVGKKLALEVYLPVNGPTIYTDSDVLFLPGGDDLARRLANHDERPLYLTDIHPTLDPQLVGPLASVTHPVNAGFFVLFRQPVWPPLLDRLSSISEIGFIQEQSLIHMMLHEENGQPLDPSRYLLVIEDWSTYRHRRMRSDVVLRHYVSTVRHKMWCWLGRSLIRKQAPA